MKYTSALFTTLAALSLAAPAFAADETYKSETKVERNNDGSGKANVTVEKSDAAGSKTYNRETSVDMDDDGDAEKTVETKSTTDPKGLFNKDTVKTKDTVKREDGHLKTEHTKTVNGKTVEDSETK